MPGERLHIILNAAGYRKKYSAFELHDVGILFGIYWLPVAFGIFIERNDLNAVSHRNVIEGFAVAGNHSNGRQTASARLQPSVCQILSHLSGEDYPPVAGVFADIRWFHAVKIGHDGNDVFYPGAVYARLEPCVFVYSHCFSVLR